MTRNQNETSFERGAESHTLDAETHDGLDSSDLPIDGDPVGDADTFDRLDSTDLVEHGHPISDSDPDRENSTDLLNTCVTCSGPAKFLSPVGRLCPDCAILDAAHNGWIPTQIRRPSH